MLNSMQWGESTALPVLGKKNLMYIHKVVQEMVVELVEPLKKEPKSIIWYAENRLKILPLVNTQAGFS